MIYRDFGKTGIKVSLLGFGCMRLPEYQSGSSWQMDLDESKVILERAVELGINYFDTAWVYSHGNNESIVGRSLKKRRKDVYIATKSPTWDIKKKDDYRRILEMQLKRLHTDYIDFYYFHGIGKDSWEDTILKHNLIEEAMKAKNEGLIKNISFSFHDKPEVMKRIIDEGEGVFASVLCQYNLVDRSNEEAMTYAREKGLAVVVMGPVAGGNLAFPSSVFSSAVGLDASQTPRIALKYVFANPDVACAISGMESIKMVEENVSILNENTEISKDDSEKIKIMADEIKKLADNYCTRCKYCQPCPVGINISFVLDQMIYHRVYGLTDVAKKGIGLIGNEAWTGSSPRDCTGCGICEDKCPQGLNIRERLVEIMKELA